MNGSTDVGNVEDELTAILHCQKHNEAQEMKSCVRFLSIQVPARANAEGLTECLCRALEELGPVNLLDNKADVQESM